jgi:hypothetical protein
LYAKTERALFALCHPTRLNAHYSQVCGKYYVDEGVAAKPAEFRQRLVSSLYYGKQEMKPNLQRYLNNYVLRPDHNDPAKQAVYMKAAARQFAEELKKKKAHKYENIRYKALNMHSYFLRKTIEFRHHEQSVDYTDITGWSLVCQELVSCAYRMTQRQIEALPRNSRRTLWALMPERLHDYIRGAWERNDNIRKGNPTFLTNDTEQWGAQ